MQSNLVEITSDQDLIDSREINDRVEYLKALADDPYIEMDEDEAVELGALLNLVGQGESLPDWEYGVTLVRDSYFTVYAEQLAEELDLINPDATWPANHIDWESAAEELQQDYTSLSFDGVDYWAR